MNYVQNDEHSESEMFSIRNVRYINRTIILPNGYIYEYENLINYYPTGVIKLYIGNYILYKGIVRECDLHIIYRYIHINIPENISCSTKQDDYILYNYNNNTYTELNNNILSTRNINNNYLLSTYNNITKERKIYVYDKLYKIIHNKRILYKDKLFVIRSELNKLLEIYNNENYYKTISIISNNGTYNYEDYIIQKNKFPYRQNDLNDMEINICNKTNLILRNRNNSVNIKLSDGTSIFSDSFILRYNYIYFNNCTIVFNDRNSFNGSATLYDYLYLSLHKGDYIYTNTKYKYNGDFIMDNPYGNGKIYDIWNRLIYAGFVKINIPEIYGTFFNNNIATQGFIKNGEHVGVHHTFININNEDSIDYDYISQTLSISTSRSISPQPRTPT